MGDALVTVGLVLLNVVIATILEIRSKRALDRIAILARPTATVLRAGEERSVDPDEIVLGDLLVASVGDQIVVDGRIVSEDDTELEESLITGESSPVIKRVGDPVFSGSFCMTGRMVYESEAVGMGSLANQLTARARAFQMLVLDLGIRAASRLVAPVSPSAGETLDRAYRNFSVEESVRSAAVIVGLVPQGLALMLVVTYAMGALRLAWKRMLLHQANAVESLSHVDVLCLDKTGTLTTNRPIWRQASRHPTARSKRSPPRFRGTGRDRDGSPRTSSRSG